MLERLKGYVQNPVFLFILWMGVGLACSLSLMMKGTYSNYVIFSQSFWHAISSSPLYVEYLQEQKDFFLYGISFTALISPFAVLPRPLGMVFWCLVKFGHSPKYNHQSSPKILFFLDQHIREYNHSGNTYAILLRQNSCKNVIYRN